MDKLPAMKFLLTVSALIDALNRLVSKSIIWLVLAAVLISTANALSRKFLNLSSNAFLELQWVLFAGIFLLGAPYALQTNSHVRIDILSSHWPTRTRVWVELWGTLFFLLPMSVLLGALSWPVFVGAFNSGEVSSNAGGLTVWPARLLVPIGFWLLTLQGLSQSIKCVGFLHGQSPDPTVATQKIPPEAKLAKAILQRRETPPAQAQ